MFVQQALGFVLFNFNWDKMHKNKGHIFSGHKWTVTNGHYCDENTEYFKSSRSLLHVLFCPSLFPTTLIVLLTSFIVVWVFLPLNFHINWRNYSVSSLLLVSLLAKLPLLIFFRCWFCFKLLCHKGLCERNLLQPTWKGILRWPFSTQWSGLCFFSNKQCGATGDGNAMKWVVERKTLKNS